MDPWRPPEELVEIGFSRSRVVMMNEAHNGLRRSRRTRETGRRILPTAHDCGCRHLAMEALSGDFAATANATRTVPEAAGGYLAQPDLRALIQTALDLGFTLIAYEVDFARKPAEYANLSREETNWREGEQARNLTLALPHTTPLLVWCGNHHLWKLGGAHVPMAVHFRERTGIDPFAIDQIQGVELDDAPRPDRWRWYERFDADLEARGGTAGFLVEEAPEGCPRLAVDAVVLSTDRSAV